MDELTRVRTKHKENKTDIRSEDIFDGSQSDDTSKLDTPGFSFLEDLIANNEIDKLMSIINTESFRGGENHLIGCFTAVQFTTP